MSKARGRATKPRNWSVTHHGRNVHVVKVKASTSRGWEQWLYLRSDAHTDNAKADHSLEVRHLKEAVERDAIIIDCGDALDLMCGVADRRQSKAMLRSSHLAAAYFDRVNRRRRSQAPPPSCRRCSGGLGTAGRSEEVSVGAICGRGFLTPCVRSWCGDAGRRPWPRTRFPLGQGRKAARYDSLRYHRWGKGTCRRGGTDAESARCRPIFRVKQMLPSVPRMPPLRCASPVAPLRGGTDTTRSTQGN